MIDLYKAIPYIDRYLEATGNSLRKYQRTSFHTALPINLDNSNIKDVLSWVHRGYNMRWNQTAYRPTAAKILENALYAALCHNLNRKSFTHSDFVQQGLV